MQSHVAALKSALACARAFPNCQPVASAPFSELVCDRGFASGLEARWKCCVPTFVLCRPSYGPKRCVFCGWQPPWMRLELESWLRHLAAISTILPVNAGPNPGTRMHIRAFRFHPSSFDVVTCQHGFAARSDTRNFPGVFDFDLLQIAPPLISFARVFEFLISSPSRRSALAQLIPFMFQLPQVSDKTLIRGFLIPSGFYGFETGSSSADRTTS